MITYSLNADEIAFIMRFRLLTNEQRSILTSMVRDLAGNQREPLRVASDTVIPLPRITA